MERYRSCVNLLIVPRVGKVQLDKLTPRQVQNLVNEINDQSGPARAAKCRTILYSAYKQAIRWQLVYRNPVEATEPVKEPQRDMTLWELEQAARFLRAAAEHRLYALFYLSMATGLRRGELLGLRWGDFTGNLLHVRQGLVKVGTRLVLSTPKTRKGIRTLALSNDMLECCCCTVSAKKRSRRSTLPVWQQRGKKLEENQLDNTFVFTSEVGTLLNPDNLKRVRNTLMDRAQATWIQEAEEAGESHIVDQLKSGKLMPKVRLHDLRHLYASIVIKSGMDAKLLAERLGHARASFTLDRYTHIFDSQRAEGAISLSNWLTTKDPESLN